MFAAKFWAAGIAACIYAGQSYAFNISALIGDLNPGSEITSRNDKNWSTAVVQRWNTYGEPTFRVAVRPVDVNDLQTVVKYAASNNIPFLASGRGHGFTTSYSKLQQGLLIDLGAFTSVKVDAVANTLTIGGAVKFGDVFDPLYQAGKEIQTGSCSCVGMVGATLGAGVGRYQGIHGLIIDAVQTITMVTAQGQLINVSATQEPDLFWGMRGAGFNFGIVTEITYGIHNLTNNGSVLNADFIFRPSENETYFELMKSFDGKLPAKLSLYTTIAVDPRYGPTIRLNAVYIGPEAEGLALIKPFLDLPYYERKITQLAWNKLVSESVFGGDALWCVKGGEHHMWTIGIKQWDVATHVSTFNAWVDLVENYPAANSSAYWIEFFPTQAVERVPGKETAYPHRDIAAHMMFVMGVTDPSLETVINDFATTRVAAHNKTSGFNGLQAYVSYARGTEGLEAMYGKSKLPRLLQLKQKWDPQGLFVFNNPLPVGSYGRN